jgi:hypothetical protein
MKSSISFADWVFVREARIIKMEITQLYGYLTKFVAEFSAECSQIAYIISI